MHKCVLIMRKPLNETRWIDRQTAINGLISLYEAVTMYVLGGLGGSW